MPRPPTPARLLTALALLAATPCLATPPAVDQTTSELAQGQPARLPRLRPPVGTAVASHPQTVSLLVRNGYGVPPPRPVAAGASAADPLAPDVAAAFASLHSALLRDVPGIQMPARHAAADAAERAVALLHIANQTVATPQMVVVVDRNPAVERLYLMLAQPGGAERWRVMGASHVSTGQAGRVDYYITPVGVFLHSDAILDFRALGTFNEHHIRGIGIAGMRVWDFGWQWAKKGWHIDGEGGDIRLQMHATDPKYLEGRLGRPASEGCVRVSTALNRFMDHNGVLDADYERVAETDPRYKALLTGAHTPTPLAGRLLVVVDSSLPQDTPPTQASRPADWPSPQAASVAAAVPDDAPGVDATAGAAGK